MSATPVEHSSPYHYQPHETASAQQGGVLHTVQDTFTKSSHDLVEKLPGHKESKIGQKSEAQLELEKNMVVHPPELKEKAAKLSYFHIDPPQSVVQGITASEYNFAKGFIAGTAIFITAPIYGAMEEMDLADDAWQDQTVAFFNGYSKGWVRGFGGFTALSLTGSITGGNQFYLGVVKAKPNPGHGRNLEENWRHVVYSRYLELCSNKEPENYQKELKDLIEEGILPEDKIDCNGVIVPYTYQFFMTDEPNDMVEGFGMMQYNAAKGFIAGVTLQASAPVVDCQEKYEEIDEKGEKGGFEGGVKGFGQGVARGFVGATILTLAGLAYGTGQFLKGFVSLKNIPFLVDFSKKSGEDYERLREDPIYSFIYQKGYGLEEFILEEEKRIIEEEEKLVEFRKKRDEYRIEFDLQVVEGMNFIRDDMPERLYVDGDIEPRLFDFPPKLCLPGERKWINRAKRLHAEAEAKAKAEAERLRKEGKELEIEMMRAKAGLPKSEPKAN